MRNKLVNDLSLLSSEALHERTVGAAKEEKRATLVLLEYLQKVDLRRLYSLPGYGSLWDYVHKALGYSEGQASERVSAIRLMNRVPEVRKSLEEGKLSLTSTSRLSVFLKREKKSKEETLDLLRKIEGKPTRTVDKILSLEAPHLPERDEVKEKGELTRIAFDLDPETQALLREAQEYCGQNLNEVFKKSLKSFLESKRSASKLATSKPSTSKPSALKPSSSKFTFPRHTALCAQEVRSVIQQNALKENTSRYIPVAMKREIELRSQNRCEYVDTRTDPQTKTEIKKRCESRYHLEIDHIHPLALGGQTTPQNLRHLCKSHNLTHALCTIGADSMQKYLKID